MNQQEQMKNENLALKQYIEQRGLKDDFGKYLFKFMYGIKGKLTEVY